MLEKNEVEKIIADMKQHIDTEIEKQNLDNALSLISTCANVLYQTNLYYMDDMLERSLKRIAKEININSYNNDYEANDGILIFFDGFGLNHRGLIQIYLNALCKFRKVVYVTYEDRRDLIPDIRKILNENSCIEKYINRKNSKYTEQIKQLNNLVKDYIPTNFFLYSTPDDVVATTVLYAYEGMFKRVQINLTDHAFWLGAGCIDVCIDFRNYGASISEKYRKIPGDKIVKIPYYPNIDKHCKFEGFPFIKTDQKVVFSGGSLYKTMSEDNLYYLMIEKILSRTDNTVFWYAGHGDSSKLKLLMKKFPNRVYFTQERKDLFQILQNCDVYINTYPVYGGLMCQYSAAAGLVPLSISQSDNREEFLKNQDSLNISFNNSDDLVNECIRLLTDIEYNKKRSIVMKQSVVTKAEFDGMINRLIDGESDSYKYEMIDIDTDSFREQYLKRLNKWNLYAMVINKRSLLPMLKIFPMNTIVGTIIKAKRKIKNG